MIVESICEANFIGAHPDRHVYNWILAILLLYGAHMKRKQTQNTELEMAMPRFYVLMVESTIAFWRVLPLSHTTNGMDIVRQPTLTPEGLMSSIRYESQPIEQNMREHITAVLWHSNSHVYGRLPVYGCVRLCVCVCAGSASVLRSYVPVCSVPVSQIYWILLT